MLIEQKLPLGIKLEDAQLAEPAERDRLMRTFERGWIGPSATYFPFSFHTRPAESGAGQRSAGLFAAATCFSFLAPRRSACACPDGLREIASSTIRTCCRSIPSLRKNLQVAEAVYEKHTTPSARSTRPLWCAPHWLSKCATAICMCSCRRSRRRRLRRASCRRRGSRTDRPAHSPRRLRAAVRPARRLHQGDTGPRRHRGQRAPGSLVGARSRSPRPSMTKHSRSGSGPRSS